MVVNTLLTEQKYSANKPYHWIFYKTLIFWGIVQGSKKIFKKFSAEKKSGKSLTILDKVFVDLLFSTLAGNWDKIWQHILFKTPLKETNFVRCNYTFRPFIYNVHRKRRLEALDICYLLLSLLNNRPFVYFSRWRWWWITKLVIFCGCHRHMTPFWFKVISEHLLIGKRLSAGICADCFWQEEDGAVIFYCLN